MNRQHSISVMFSQSPFPIPISSCFLWFRESNSSHGGKKLHFLYIFFFRAPRPPWSQPCRKDEVEEEEEKEKDPESNREHKEKRNISSLASKEEEERRKEKEEMRKKKEKKKEEKEEERRWRCLESPPPPLHPEDKTSVIERDRERKAERHYYIPPNFTPPGLEVIQLIHIYSEKKERRGKNEIKLFFLFLSFFLLHIFFSSSSSPGFFLLLLLHLLLIVTAEREKEN